MNSVRPSNPPRSEARKSSTRTSERVAHARCGKVRAHGEGGQRVSLNRDEGSSREPPSGFQKEPP